MVLNQESELELLFCSAVPEKKYARPSPEDFKESFLCDF